MSTVSSLASSLPPSAQERLDQLLASDAITNPAHADHAAAQAEAQDLSKWSGLVNSDAYRDPTDADHNVVKTRVARYFEAHFGSNTSTRRVSPVVFDTTDPTLAMRRGPNFGS